MWSLCTWDETDYRCSPMLDICKHRVEASLEAWIMQGKRLIWSNPGLWGKGKASNFQSSTQRSSHVDVPWRYGCLDCKLFFAIFINGKTAWSSIEFLGTTNDQTPAIVDSGVLIWAEVCMTVKSCTQQSRGEQNRKGTMWWIWHRWSCSAYSTCLL